MFRSARLILNVDLMILIISMTFAPVFYYLGCPSMAYTLLFSSACAFIFPFLLHFTANLTLCGDFFTMASLVVFFCLCLSTGAIRSPFVIWFLTIPPIAFFYLKKNKARLWMGMTFCAILTLFFLDLLHIQLLGQLDDRWMPFIVLFNFSAVLWLFTSVILSFSTGVKRMNGRLTISNDKLKQSNQELERFAYIASHDLKSPLRNIISFIQLFKKHYDGRLDKVGSEYIEFISSGSRQMYTLIEDILEYSRTDSRNRKTEVIDLGEVVYLITQQIKKSSISDKYHITYDEMPIIKADLTLMQQLFQNLIENGLKYNDHHQPRVHIFYEKKEQYHSFIVRDNGIGIDPRHREKIFEMFRRLHGNDTYSGTGIGLAICKKIVEEYDGQISVKAAPSRGTEFHLTLKSDCEPLKEKKNLSKNMEPIS
ncbi:MAG: ATP-binding protein [Bacteroidota bacterium]